MNLLNLGCGGDRPQEKHWTNMDHLHALLAPGTPERTNLDKETNYIDWDLIQHMEDSLPRPFGFYDGILCQHVLEHFELHHAVRVAEMAREALEPGGWFVASVPDSEFFLDHLHEDTRDNAVRIFGEPISEPWHERFFDYAMMHLEHKQAFSEESLKVVLIAAGFKLENIFRQTHDDTPRQDVRLREMFNRLNRIPFSLVLYAQNL